MRTPWKAAFTLITAGLTAGAAACGDDSADDDAADDAVDDASGEGGSTTGAGDSTESDGSTGTPACSDVHGSFGVHVDGWSGSMSLCAATFGEIGSAQTCTITQDDCALTFACEGDVAASFPSGTLDMQGQYHGAGTVMNTGYECTIDFSVDRGFGFEWECSGTAEESSSLCYGRLSPM